MKNIGYIGLAILITAVIVLSGCEIQGQTEPVMLLALEYQATLIDDGGTYDIADVVSQREISIAVQNAGSGDLKLNEVTVTGDEEFSLISFPSTIDKSGRILINFEDAGNFRRAEATVSIRSNAVTAPDRTFKIFGYVDMYGTDAPEIEVHYINYDSPSNPQIANGSSNTYLGVYDSSESSHLYRIKVSNDGFQDLKMEHARIIAADSDPRWGIATNLVKTTLVPKDSTFYLLEFTPDGTETTVANQYPYVKIQIPYVNSDGENDTFEFSVYLAINIVIY